MIIVILLFLLVLFGLSQSYSVLNAIKVRNFAFF
jgi:hypothetical protein